MSDLKILAGVDFDNEDDGDPITWKQLLEALKKLETEGKDLSATVDTIDDGGCDNPMCCLKDSSQGLYLKGF